ncbi:MAG: uracil-DNA glycosylase [Alphaproteobacteria bacterium]|nr:uracil-DNA glycosylase [Alphaproteobacteria bacterium]
MGQAALHEVYNIFGVTEFVSDVAGGLLQTENLLDELARDTAVEKTQQTAPPPAKSRIATGAAIEDAVKLARAANTLDELATAIAGFEGLALRKTAMNMVFADGNRNAKIMLVGEAPGADEDRQGKPFVGVSGQLLDKILAFIGLSRASNLYISNILNFRPPGNRTPYESEMDISLPFIERHIALVNPAILLLAGNTSLKTLLRKTEGITKLRGKWQKFEPKYPELFDTPPDILCLPTYHPAFLLRSPDNKPHVWQDILALLQKMRELKL